MASAPNMSKFSTVFLISENCYLFKAPSVLPGGLPGKLASKRQSHMKVTGFSQVM